VPDSTLLTHRRLVTVSQVLFVLFGTFLLGALLPPSLLDPAWQLRLIGVLINTAAFPLVGLAMIYVGAEMAPHSEPLASQRRLYARFASFAVAGFLLLIPLQAWALWQLQANAASSQAAQIRSGAARVEALRQAAATASTADELRKRMVAQGGPELNPTLLEEPLPQLKDQLKSFFDQAEQSITRQRASFVSPSPWRPVPDILRNALACLALATGFAALAQRPHGEFSLLQDGINTCRKFTSWRPSLKENSKGRKRQRRIRF